MRRLKQRGIAKFREELLLEQGGVCKLCGTPLYSSEANLDHCFPPDVEVLTNRGFLSFDKAVETDCDYVQWDKGELSLVAPLKVIEKHFEGDLVHLEKRSFSVLCTKEHNAVVEDRRSGELSFIETDELFKNGVTHRRDLNIPKSGRYFEGGGIPLTDDEIRLYVAFHADGGFSTGARFRLRKKRKIERLKVLLENCNIPYTIHNTDAFQAYIGKKDTPFYFTKNFDLDLFSFTQDQLLVFVSEIPHWDGCTIGRSIQYSTTNLKDREYVKLATILSGMRGTEWTKERHGNHNSLHFLSFTFPSSNDSIRNTRKTYIPYKGKVYCVSVPSGAIVIRHNGCVTVYGNCHTSGRCRGAVHRECNILLGKIENYIKRYGKRLKQDSKMLKGFLSEVFNYMEADYSGMPYHPKHIFLHEKEIKLLKKRIKSVKKNSTKAKLRAKIDKLRRLSER